MSSTTAARGKQSRSASAIVAATASAYHLLKIDGYSRTKDVPTGKSIKSHPFSVGDHRWFIKYYPNGLMSGDADHISLFLLLDEDVDTEVNAKYDFSLVDDDEAVEEEQAPSPLASISAKVFINFVGQSSYGIRKFIKREDFEKSKHLKDDSFTVRCDVIVNEFHAEMAKSAAPKYVSVPPSDLNRHLGDLLRTGKGADVVFEVGDETFAAHRCVLASRSPVFSAKLFGFMKEGDTCAAAVVRIEEMEAQVFKALLSFAYTDSLPETRKEEEGVMCQHLLVAADRYNMERLKLNCEEKLNEHIATDTVATILALAEQHHCDGLKKACFDFLSSQVNLRAVVATDSFHHVYRSCPSVVMELIAMSSVSSLAE